MSKKTHKEKTVEKTPIPQKISQPGTWMGVLWGIFIFLVLTVIAPNSNAAAVDGKWLVLGIGLPVLSLIGVMSLWNSKKSFSLLDSAVLVYGIVILVSWIRAPYHKAFLPFMLHWLTPVFVYFLVSRTVRFPKTLYGVMLGCLTGGVVASVYAILQFAGVDPVSWKNTGEVVGFITSFYGNSNLFGWLLSLLWPFALYYLIRNPENEFDRIARYIPAPLILVAAGLSRNRTGLLAIVLVTLLWGYWLSRMEESTEPRPDVLDKLRGILKKLFPQNKKVLIGLVLVGLFVLAGLGHHYAVRSDRALKTRLLSWKTSMSIFREMPLTGAGPGRYGILYSDYQGRLLREPANKTFIRTLVESDSQSTLHAHNEWVQSLAQEGILGLAALAFLATAIYIQLRKRFITAMTDSQKIHAWMLTGSMVALGICSLLGFPLMVPATGLVVGVWLGLLDTIDSTETEPDFVSKYYLPQILAVILLGGLWIGLLPVSVTQWQVSRLIKSGRNAAEIQGDLNTAINKMSEAVMKQPENGLALFYMAGYLALSEQYDLAIRGYQQSISSYYDAKTWFNLGQVYYSIKDYGKAEICYQKSLVNHPTETDALRQLAYCYLQLGKPEVALPLLIQYMNGPRDISYDVQVKSIIEVLTKGVPSKGDNPS